MADICESLGLNFWSTWRKPKSLDSSASSITRSLVYPWVPRVWKHCPIRLILLSPLLYHRILFIKEQGFWYPPFLDGTSDSFSMVHRLNPNFLRVESSSCTVNPPSRRRWCGSRRSSTRCWPFERFGSCSSRTCGGKPPAKGTRRPTKTNGSTLVFCDPAVIICNQTANFSKTICSMTNYGKSSFFHVFPS